MERELCFCVSATHKCTIIISLGCRDRRPDGPSSYRSQIEYQSIIKIKITDGKDILIFCFRTVGDAGPYRFLEKFFVSPTDQTKIYMSLFTIKSKETRGSLLSTGFYIAIELNKRSGMSLWLTIAQSTLENISSSHVCTL